MRHFGPAPLVEDDSVRSDGTTVVNPRTGYELNGRIGLTLDVYNLLDGEDDDTAIATSPACRARAHPSPTPTSIPSSRARGASRCADTSNAERWPI